MAFTNNVISVARETKVFVGLESTPGTQVGPDDGAMQLILVHQAGQVAQNIRLIDDPQYRNTRSRLLPTTASYDVGKFSLSTLLKTVAGSGTPADPEIKPLLVSLFGKEPVTDTSWFGSTPHKAFKLLGVSPGGTVYPSFTIWFKEGHTVFYAAGATCNQGEFEVNGNDLAKAAFSGEFMRHGWCGTDRPTGGGSGTSLTVQEPMKFWIADEDAGDKIYIQFLQEDGVTLSSPVGVTHVNYGSGVLTLDGSATWNASDIVVPYLPAGTEIGRQMYGKYGLVKIGAFVDKTFSNLPSSTQLVNTSKITITNGIKYHPDVKDGKNYPTEYVAPAFREVRGELGLFQYRNVPEFNFKAQQDPLIPDYVTIPTQDKAGSDGRIIKFHMPRAIWETPNKSGEDEKSSTIPFRTVATTDYDDEFAMVYYGG